jgi:Protein of unknown function (DUF2637)
MPATTAPASRTETRSSSRIDQTIDIAIMIGLAVLILVGFATSYRTLRDLAATTGGYPPWLAPAVPLSFDLGIVVLSLKVARAAREGRTAPVMRLLVAALSAATVVANASAASTPTARLLHAVPPAMFVICFESVIVTARLHALARMRLLPAPLPRIRTVRWLLALPSTWVHWRTLVISAAPIPTPEGQSPPLPGSSPGSRGSSGTDDRVRGVAPTAASRYPASGVTTPVAARSSAGASERDAAVARFISVNPAAPAPDLVRYLRNEGQVVSVRTAQRLRANCLATQMEHEADRRHADSRSSTPAGDDRRWLVHVAGR